MSVFVVGRFSLDPNRVLDVILSAFENQLEEQFFIQLLQAYPCELSTFVNILGFKFQAHQVCTVFWLLLRNFVELSYAITVVDR